MKRHPFPPIVTAGDIKTNPTNPTTLLQTPALKGMFYEMVIHWWTTVAADVIISLRNSNDTADLWAIRQRLTANPSPFELNFGCSDNQFIKIVTNADIVGSIQASTSLTPNIS